MDKDPEYISDMMGVKDKRTMHVDISSIGVPRVKNWKIGQEVTVTLRGRVKSLSEAYDGKSVSACLEVDEPSDDE